MGQPQGIRAFIQARINRNTAFPDWHVTVDDVIAEDDKVVARARGRGTHQGPFMGIAATGKPVTTARIVIYGVTGGKLAEHWINGGDIGLLRRLGAIPYSALRPANWEGS